MFVGNVAYPPRLIFSPLDHSLFLSQSAFPRHLLEFISGVGGAVAAFNAEGGGVSRQPVPAAVRVLNGSLGALCGKFTQVPFFPPSDRLGGAKNIRFGDPVFRDWSLLMSELIPEIVAGVLDAHRSRRSKFLSTSPGYTVLYEWLLVQL